LGEACGSLRLVRLPDLLLRCHRPEGQSPEREPAAGEAGRRHHAETVARRICAPGGRYVRDGLIIGTKRSRARAVASGLPSLFALKAELVRLKVDVTISISTRRIAGDDVDPRCHGLVG